MNRATPMVVCFSFTLLVFSSLFSCAGSSPFSEGKAARVIEHVPFYPQEMYQCGPASLAGVLNFWGTAVSPEEIAEEIYSKSAKGTLTLDMILYAKKKGFNAGQYQGSYDDIQRNVESGVPLVVMVDYGFWVYQQNHYIIVFGYNENGVIVHSGKKPHQLIPLKEFLRSWGKTNFWTLRITPERRGP
jgi:ABC-type bacteriocin/lantibiotic exporter with double-glycine peptidase domain